MPKGRPDADFRERLIATATSLPPQQRSIADYMLEHLTSVPFLSVPELARRVGVSEATVVRFAQRLGYPGFTELKMELVEMLQNRLGNGTEDATEDVADDLLEAVANLETTNIGRTVESLDRRHYQEVAETLFAARHVYTFGMGVSAILAELAAYALLQVGVRTSCLPTNFSSPREQLVGIEAEDLVMVISLPPYSRQSLDILRDAGELGIPTIAVVDRATAPAANLARRALPVRSDNMMFTNAVAAVTVMINALATEIAATHREEALAALSRINRVLADDEGVLTTVR